MEQNIKQTKIIFITGGVVSSLGKGLASASLASLLQERGYNTRIRKLDPYLNIDPGTMNPIQHGEVFVTDDGAETDLDLGHYERFTDQNARKSDNVTAGRIYQTLLNKERKGEYLGATVQVIPHVTNLIKEFILADLDKTDFLICEIGGTVGDIEALPFFEAIRQLGNELGEERTLYAHLTLVPYVAAAKELKTKPTQHSVKELRSIGIQPDILLCRTEYKIPASEKKKIALFCNVKNERVIEAKDTDIIYKVPVNYHKEGLDIEILKKFGLPYDEELNLDKWTNLTEAVKKQDKQITVAIVGKYVSLEDAYKSIIEALNHAAIANGNRLKIKWVNARELTLENIEEEFTGVDAILVPGAFGSSGAEGKMLSAKYARENKIPYLGICFGMQMAVLEFAKNVVGIKEANSSEFVPHKNPLIGLINEWTNSKGEREVRSFQSDLGGTMRLGAYDCNLKEGSKTREIYGEDIISERHRHRYEVNINYQEQIEQHGMMFSGFSSDGTLPEIVELKDHPFFVAVQFHPEFKSRPFKPHPLFVAFTKAAR